MFNFIISLVFFFLLKKKWRQRNHQNRTVLSRRANIDLIQVGRGSYGEINVINHSNSYKLKIGNFCSIAPEVFFIVCGDHRTDCVSTYPFKVAYCNYEFEAQSKGDIVIEDDVWIGFRATILSGVKIGRGAIVTAGAVVTKNVEPYTVVGGVPAKKIRQRFSASQIEILNKIDFSTIKESTIRDNIELFYKKVDDDLLSISKLIQ